MSSPASRRLSLLVVAVLGVAMAAFGLRRGAGPTPGEAEQPLADEWAQPTATPALAERTVDRLQLFRTGTAGRRLTLTSNEITALLRHALPGVVPTGIADPVVTLEEGVVFVEARLVTAEFVGRAPLASVLGALPDTVSVDLSGRVEVHGDRLVFHVLEAHAARVPLPASAVAAIAGEMAAQSGEGVVVEGEPSLSIRWPSGVAFVAVVDDRLILDRDEPLPDRAVDGSDDP